jgi:purine catabolism regulator
MSIRVSDLVAMPALDLGVAVGGLGLGGVLTAAHVSELLEPGAWLQGGELLMTIGLQLPMTDAACSRYVAHLKDAGATALALGLGPDFPHQEAPLPLVEAAREQGLPMLTVPPHIPFIALTKAVFAALAADEHAAMQRSLDLHRELTRAASAGGGVTGLAATWWKRTGTHLLVIDRAGRHLAATASVADDLAERAHGLVVQVEGRGVHASSRRREGPDLLEVQPLGVRHLRGFAVFHAVGKDIDRVAAAALTSMLTLEFERTHLADEPERHRRAALVTRLLDPGHAPDPADLQSAGLAGARAIVVAIGTESLAEPAQTAADLALALPGGLVRNADSRIDLICPESFDPRPVLARFAPGASAGLSKPAPPRALHAALEHAIAALHASRAVGGPVEQPTDLVQQLLTTAVDAEAVRSFAAAVLAPISAADPGGGLTDTLRTWLAHDCSVDATAQRLGVHRHTVRNRLRRMAEVTAGRITTPDGQLEYRLALKATAVGTAHGG